MIKNGEAIPEQPQPFNFSYAVFEEPNLCSRKTMEDFTISESDLTKDQKWSLFCVLDGHGGSEVALYTKKNYPKLLKGLLLDNSNTESTESKISESIDKLSTMLFEKKNFNQGSTFCGILMNVIEGVYYTINIGDSKVIKASQENFDSCNLKVEPLTVEHKVSNKKELKRIKQIHDLIKNRLGGQLLVTRALGDFKYAKYGLTSEPDICRHQITSEKYLIIGSDGVWDVIDHTGLNAILSLNKTHDSNHIAKIIVEKAVVKSMDNISLIVISFIPQEGLTLLHEPKN